MTRRIFLTLPVSASSGFSDQMYRYIFFDTLVSLGHDVVFYPYGDAVAATGGKTEGRLDRITENLYATFNREHQRKPFDLFLSYYHSGQIGPELFRQVRENTLCINYTTNFHQIGLYEPLLGETHLNLFVSDDAAEWFRARGYPAFYMPFAGLRRHLAWNPGKDGRIVFSGTSYGPRAQYLWRLLQQEIPVHIYGVNWIRAHRKRAFLRAAKTGIQILAGNRMSVDTAYRTLNDLVLDRLAADYRDFLHEPLPDDRYQALLTDSSVVLNFPESRHGHDFSNPNVLIGANLRDFEVPTAGSLLFTQDNPEIRRFFEPDKEIVAFTGEKDLAEKARFYLDHPSEVLRIASAGRMRAEKEHLWEHRFDTLFDHLERNFL